MLIMDELSLYPRFYQKNLENSEFLRPETSRNRNRVWRLGHDRRSKDTGIFRRGFLSGY